MTAPTDEASGREPDGDTDWTLITVTHNSADDLEHHWGSVDLGSVRWVVVDNASTDATVDVATRLGATVIRTGLNRGFSHANNLGLSTVTTRYVAFINPDVTIGDGRDLALLAELIEFTGGLVAPQLLNEDGSEQPNARGVPYPLAKFGHRAHWCTQRSRDSYSRTGFAEPTYVAWVMGAVVAARTDVFRALHGWDERYFIYYEDHELGLRAWRQGLTVTVLPTVRWRHGWRRATSRLHLRAWMHEIRSAMVFYGRHPFLLTQRQFARRVEFTRLRELLWTPVALDSMCPEWPP